LALPQETHSGTWLRHSGSIKLSLKASEWVSLGQLKGNIGDQTYNVPAGVDLSAYGSVVIWCEQFGVLFSTASLAF
jgi:hypothetical protein